VLHEKHPIFKKNDVETLKKILTESSVVYLNRDQILYKQGTRDNFVYFVLFGRLNLQVADHTLPIGKDGGESLSTTSTSIGNVNIGWTVGEEILFDRNLQIRPETCYADTESCLLGLNKGKLN